MMLSCETLELLIEGDGVAAWMILLQLCGFSLSVVALATLLLVAVVDVVDQLCLVVAVFSPCFSCRQLQ